MHDTTRAWSTYEAEICAARRRLGDDPAVRRLLDPDLSRDVLLRFLIEYTARAAQLTERVDHWIRRAGQRCTDLGMPRLGAALVHHAENQEGHHLVLVSDTARLIEQWNAAHPDAALDLEDALDVGRTRAMDDYVDLQDRAIAGDAPHVQVAVELEIEGLLTTFGPRLIAQCLAVLGERTLAGLGFLAERVALDTLRARIGRRLLELVLAARPADAPRLADAGARALDAQFRLIGECLALAEAACERLPLVRAA